MDKYNGVYLYNGVLFSQKGIKYFIAATWMSFENKVQYIAATWMSFENMLSGRNQAQKITCIQFI